MTDKLLDMFEEYNQAIDNAINKLVSERDDLRKQLEDATRILEYVRSLNVERATIIDTFHSELESANKERAYLHQQLDIAVEAMVKATEAGSGFEKY